MIWEFKYSKIGSPSPADYVQCPFCKNALVLLKSEKIGDISSDDFKFEQKIIVKICNKCGWWYTKLDKKQFANTDNSTKDYSPP